MRVTARLGHNIVLLRLTRQYNKAHLAFRKHTTRKVAAISIHQTRKLQR